MFRKMANPFEKYINFKMQLARLSWKMHKYLRNCLLTSFEMEIFGCIKGKKSTFPCT